MVFKTNSITIQAQCQGLNHKSMEAAIYKILINFLYFLKSNKIPSFITKCTFLCRLQTVVDTYGSCLRHLLGCPRFNTFILQLITLNGSINSIQTLQKCQTSLNTDQV